jgi:hypothetical protein
MSKGRHAVLRSGQCQPQYRISDHPSDVRSLTFAGPYIRTAPPSMSSLLNMKVYGTSGCSSLPGLFDRLF